jgi:ABC-2 type transport system ATP-binding protein
VRVRSPQAADLAARLAGPDVTVEPAEDGLLEIHGATSVEVGELAAAAGIVLHELTPLQGSLEDAYMSLTSESVEYHSAEIPGSEPRPTTAAAAPTAPVTTGEDAR